MDNLPRSPFINDPFTVIWTAFKNLYPDKECTVCWGGNLCDEENNPVFGTTDFNETTGEVTVIVDAAKLKVIDAMEVFAHELAHVAVGVGYDHDEVWENAFDRILAEHDRLVNIMFPDSVEVSRGGCDNED